MNTTINSERNKIRAAYMALEPHERRWVNIRVEALLLEKYKVTLDIEDRKLWTLGRKSTTSPYDQQYMVCYVQAMLDRIALIKSTGKLVAQLAEA